MRRPMFKTQPVDESFFHSAPFQLRDTFEINRSAPEVWADLTGRPNGPT